MRRHRLCQCKKPSTRRCSASWKGVTQVVKFCLHTQCRNDAVSLLAVSSLLGSMSTSVGFTEREQGKRIRDLASVRAGVEGKTTDTSCGYWHNTAYSQADQSVSEQRGPTPVEAVCVRSWKTVLGDDTRCVVRC